MMLALNLQLINCLNRFAENYGSRSIAVVLSGYRFRWNRWMSSCYAMLVASPSRRRAETAKYDGMPNSVIRARLADLTLSPEEIANYLSEESRATG